MLRKLVITVVVVVLLLAQAPQAWNTGRSWLGLDDWDWWKRDAVTSPERAKELAAKGLREQLISFDEAMASVDYRYGVKSEDQRYDIYVIGVGQMTLNVPEEIGRVVVTGSRPPPPHSIQDIDAVPTQPITGQFNNVLIFDRRTSEMTRLFETRLAISQFQYGWRTKPEVLVIFATDRDTNKDGKLGSGDLEDVYVYTFNDRKVHRVRMPASSSIEIMDLPDVDYVVVRARVDHDRDGDASEYKGGDYMTRVSPNALFRVDLKTFTVTPFVPEKTLQELQTTLDGPKPGAGQPPKP